MHVLVLWGSIGSYPRAVSMLGKHSTTVLQLQICVHVLSYHIVGASQIYTIIKWQLKIQFTFDIDFALGDSVRGICCSPGILTQKVQQASWWCHASGPETTLRVAMCFFTVTVECVIYSLKAPWLISDEGGSTEAPVMVKIHLLTWQPQLEMWPMPRRTWLIFIDLFVFLRFLKMFLIKFPLTVSHMYILCSDCLPPTFSYLPSTPAITLSPCRSLSHIHVI